VCVCGHVGMCVSTIKMKTPDHKDVNLSTVVNLDTESKSVDFGFKGQESGAQGHHLELFASAAT